MPIHKCIGCGEPRSQEELRSREETRPDLTGGSQAQSRPPPANPGSRFADYTHFPHRAGGTPQGNGSNDVGVLLFFFFKTCPCLNNDVGIRSQGC